MSTKPAKPGFINKLRANSELWTLLQYLIITGVTTGIGLLLRYILMAYGAGDNFAYTAYYVSSVILFYLWKWAVSEGKDARSFVPRFLGYCALNAVSVLAGNLLLSVLLGWGINSELAFWLTCPFTFLINYLGGRLVVFKDFDDRSAAKNKNRNPEGDESDGGKE